MQGGKNKRMFKFWVLLAFIFFVALSYLSGYYFIRNRFAEFSVINLVIITFMLLIYFKAKIFFNLNYFTIFLWVTLFYLAIYVRGNMTIFFAQIKAVNPFYSLQIFLLFIIAILLLIKKKVKG